MATEVREAPGTAAVQRGSKTGDPPTIALRLAGAGLVGTMGGIHLYLWLIGYSGIATIGPLFMANFVGAVVLGLALLTVPARFLVWVAAMAVVFAAGTLGGLLVSITVGLFGFQDSLQAPLAVASVWVESITVVTLAALAGIRWRRRV